MIFRIPARTSALTHEIRVSIGRAAGLVPQDVRVHPQRDRRVRVPQPGRDDVHRYASLEEQGRVDMAQVVQPDRWERSVRVGVVVVTQQLRHESGWRIREQGRPDLHTKHAVTRHPGAIRDHSFGVLPSAVLPGHVSRAGFDADHPLAPALGRPLDPLAIDGAADADTARRAQVDVQPTQAQQLTTPGTGESREPVEREEPVFLGADQDRSTSRR